MTLDGSGGSTVLKLATTATGSGAADGFDIIMGGSSEAYLYNRENGPIIFGTNNAGVGRFDSSGNLLVGTTSGSCHTIQSGGSEGTKTLEINAAAAFYRSASGGANAAATAFVLSKNSVTNRSLNAGGTVNQSGADYAEYERNNGLTITKGSLVGYKEDGTLTLTFAKAIRFGVKSTAPGLVGGDTWADDVGVRPEQPTFNPPPYTGPAAPGEAPQAPADDADEATIEAYAEAYTDWQDAKAAHDTAMDSHHAVVAVAQAVFEQSTMPTYEAELAAFEVRLETARQLVDRIAYSGKVPCNVTGATPGDYIVATAAADGSITGVSVTEPDFAQYRKSVGRVNRLLPDGRCEVAVIIH